MNIHELQQVLKGMVGVLPSGTYQVIDPHFVPPGVDKTKTPNSRVLPLGTIVVQGPFNK